MKIDHIGYAVRNLSRAQTAFRTLGGTLEQVIEDSSRNLYIQFGSLDGYRIEFVSPVDRSVPSPVDNYLSKTGPAPYHICYCSHGLEKDIENLSAQGFKVLIPPQTAIAFQNRRVAFLMNAGLGMIELVEE